MRDMGPMSRFFPVRILTHFPRSPQSALAETGKKD
jgi:hypothetical protein